MQARGHEAAIFIVKRQYATPPWLNGLALSWRQNTLVYAWAAWFWTHFYITWAKPSIGVLNFNVRSSADGGRRVRQKKNVSVLTWQPLCSDHPKLSDGVKNVTIWSRSEGKRLCLGTTSTSYTRSQPATNFYTWHETFLIFGPHVTRSRYCSRTSSNKPITTLPVWSLHPPAYP
jgi:hypothetical protein